MKTILRWPGAKWRIADWIIRQFPEHDVYCEPFFGSGAVFFRKAPSGTETINDIDGNIVNLFRVVRDSADELAKAIEMTPYSREEYRECYNRKGTKLSKLGGSLFARGRLSAAKHIAVRLGHMTGQIQCLGPSIGASYQIDYLIRLNGCGWHRSSAWMLWSSSRCITVVTRCYMLIRRICGVRGRSCIMSASLQRQINMNRFCSSVGSTQDLVSSAAMIMSCITRNYPDGASAA